jgi:hypothetical protein
LVGRLHRIDAMFRRLEVVDQFNAISLENRSDRGDGEECFAPTRSCKYLVEFGKARDAGDVRGDEIGQFIAAKFQSRRPVTTGSARLVF